MGLLDLALGKTNPFASYVDDNKNWISSLASGFGSGTNLASGLSNAVQLGPQGQRLDDAYAVTKKAEAERQKQINLTSQYLRSNPAFADLVPLVDAGQGGAALAEAFRRQSAGVKSDAPIEVNGQLVDPNTYKVLGDFRDPKDLQPSDAAKAPSGYQTDPTDPTKLSFIPGGPADPSTAAKTTEATRRNQQLATVITPELAGLIGDGKTPGTFDALADPGNQVWNGLGVGNFLASPQYQQAQNSLKTIVASYLYSVSGATANPGEVQNQVDVLTPKPGESKESVAAKKQRLVQMVDAVKAAATGKPINIDDPAATGQPSGNTTSTGVQWSIEP